MIFERKIVVKYGLVRLHFDYIMGRTYNDMNSE